jgi:hypothetical protein
MSENLKWVKAKASGSSGGSCVELAFTPDGHATGMVRDSKAPERGHLTAGLGAFTEFITNMKAGRLDLPQSLTRQ